MIKLVLKISFRVGLGKIFKNTKFPALFKIFKTMRVTLMLQWWLATFIVGETNERSENFFLLKPKTAL